MTKSLETFQFRSEGQRQGKWETQITKYSKILFSSHCFWTGEEQSPRQLWRSRIPRGILSTTGSELIVVITVYILSPPPSTGWAWLVFQVKMATVWFWGSKIVVSSRMYSEWSVLLETVGGAYCWSFWSLQHGRFWSGVISQCDMTSVKTCLLQRFGYCCQRQRKAAPGNLYGSCSWEGWPRQCWPWCSIWNAKHRKDVAQRAHSSHTTMHPSHYCKKVCSQPSISLCHLFYVSKLPSFYRDTRHQPFWIRTQPKDLILHL